MEVVALALYYAFDCAAIIADSAIEPNEIQFPHDCILCSFALFFNPFLTCDSHYNMYVARVISYFSVKSIRLCDLTPRHIEEFYQQILADSCTTNTVIHYHAIIRKALQSAVKKDILDKNPADKVEKPRKNVYHATFYGREEMMTLFEVIKVDLLEVCIRITAYYGLRRSEVLGLRWSAVDFEHKTLSICHKVIETQVNGKFVPLGEDVLKTKSSFRTLPLLAPVEKILLAEKIRQEQNLKLLGSAYNCDYQDYICRDNFGKLFRPNFVTEHFSWLIGKYNLKKLRFHDLRHSCALLLLACGISMKQIQIWLRHSTFATTADTYSHLDTAAQEELAAAMAAMFQPDA